MSLLQDVAVAAQVLLDSSRALTSDIDNIMWTMEFYQDLASTIKTSLVLIGEAYNASLPINRLPSELLGVIFSHIRSPALPAMSDGYPLALCPFDSYKSLISATQVCSRWRTVALQKASLWTEVDRSASRRGGLADVILQRSATAPLHLRCNCDMNQLDGVFQLIQTNGIRLRKRDLGGSRWWLLWQASDLCVLFSLDMPLLQSLKVALDRPSFSSSMNAPVVSFKTLPVLTALTLVGCIYIPTVALPNLTHLHICYPDHDHNWGPALLSLLCYTPSLEVLELEDNIHIDDSAPYRPHLTSVT